MRGFERGTGFRRAMRLSSLLIMTSAALLLVSVWNRNALPGRIDFDPRLALEPAQTGTNRAPFPVTFNDVEYFVEPEYAYELFGMIVSFRHHDGQSRMHRLANDHLNMLDVCVIWGGNTEHPDLAELSFWNGIFTCNVTTRDRDAWEAFDMYQLSNNHLVSDDEYIRDRVTRIRVGDQIRVRGYLASYSSPNGGRRGTSTTRKDTGDGACETIYVEDFEIITAATNYWRMSIYASALLLAVGLGSHFRRPYRPYAD